jgi:hypothetical protein
MALEPVVELVGGTVVGWLVGVDVGWLGDAVGVGEAVGWAVGVTRGSALLSPPCQENATYPPSGTVSEPTPCDANDHRPDFPSDHHRDQ